MAEPQSGGDAPNRQLTHARNLAAHLLLNRNFNGSLRTVSSARKLTTPVDLSTLKAGTEEYKNAQVNKNCDKAVMDKVKYTINGLNARHAECLRRRDQLGDWFENNKPAEEAITKFAILFSTFEIFSEQYRLIERTTKVGRETSPFLTEEMISTLEKSLDAFEYSIENDYIMDDVYDNVFGLRNICHEDLQQICITLIPLEKKEKPIFVAKNPNRYNPFDLMFIAMMLRIENNVEATKFVSLTSSNHQLIGLLRAKVVARSRDLPSNVLLPLPNVPIDCPNPTVEDLWSIRSQNFSNHFNDMFSLFGMLVHFDQNILVDSNFEFVTWLESIRQMSIVVLGNIMEKACALETNMLTDNNSWQRGLYFLSVCARLCCFLLNINKTLALYVDKKHGLFGKRSSSMIIEIGFNKVFHHLNETFNREQVEEHLRKIQDDVIKISTEYLSSEDPKCSECFTEAPDLTQFHRTFEHEPITMCDEKFSSLMKKYSAEIVRQLAIEKFEIHRLAGRHECINLFYETKAINKAKLVGNIIGPNVDAFSSNVAEFLTDKEVETAFEDGEEYMMVQHVCQSFSVDLAKMARNAAGDIKLALHMKDDMFLMFNTRFRFYVGTRIREMKKTTNISRFFFAFMWQVLKMHQSSGTDEDHGQSTHEALPEDVPDKESDVQSPTLFELSEDVLTFIDNCALLYAERFLIHADRSVMYNDTATKTPKESLIYRWLINKYFEPSRQFFYRSNSYSEKYGEKGILFSGNNVTTPLNEAEEAEFKELHTTLLSKPVFNSPEIDKILGVDMDLDDDEENDRSFVQYVFYF